MEYIIRLIWDEESGVWIATNDEIPVALEADSVDVLIERVRRAIPELIEMNHLQMPKSLYFLAEKHVEVLA